MTDRFYYPDLSDSIEAELTGTEAHHLLHVMRAKIGDRVELFDGRGGVATVEIVAAKKKSATLKVVERRLENADHTPVFTLATAVPKGERFRWLIEKATELGVDRIVPLETTRGVVHPGDGKLDKMQQTVIAACKQSGRNRLMEIEERTAWSEFLEREIRNGATLVAHPSGEPLGRVVDTIPKGQSLTAAVGPEGGFTDAEIEAAVCAGAKLVSLGSTNLRTETAAIAMAAVVMQMRR